MVKHVRHIIKLAVAYVLHWCLDKARKKPKYRKTNGSNTCPTGFEIWLLPSLDISFTGAYIAATRRYMIWLSASHIMSELLAGIDYLIMIMFTRRWTHLRAYRSIHLKTQFHRAQDMHSIHDCSAHKQSRVVLFTWMTVCTSPWCQLYTTRVTSHTHTKVGRLISTRLRRHRVISLRNTTDRYIAELSFAVCH